MAILSSAVSAGDTALASQYNNLRTDLLTGDITVAGVKTFSSIPVFSAGITLSDDSSIADGKKINFSTDGYIRSHPTTANLLQIVSNGGAILNIGAAHISIPATQRFYLDGGGDTYIAEGSANYISIVTGGSPALELTESQHVILQATKRLYLDGGGDTYIVEYAANNIAFFTNGVGALYLNDSQNATLGGDLNIPNSHALYWGSYFYTHWDSSSWYLYWQGFSAGDKFQVTYQGIAYSNGWSLYSDKRLKINLKDTKYSINDLMKIKIWDFNIKDNQKNDTGIIAQDLNNIYPVAVHIPEDPDKMWGIDYGKLTPLIIKALQDLRNQVNMIERRIA